MFDSSLQIDTTAYEWPTPRIYRREVMQQADNTLRAARDECAILDALAGGPLTKAEIVRRTGLAKPTVCRAMSTARLLDPEFGGISVTGEGRGALYALT